MTSFSVSVDPEALLKIQQAKNWYNSQSAGLGDRFEAQVTRQINSLRANSELYATRYKNVRCMIVRRFPYLVHFTVHEARKLVIISDVIHTKRGPNHWPRV